MKSYNEIKKRENQKVIKKIMDTVKHIRTACDYTAIDFSAECDLTNKAYTMLEREGRGTAITLHHVLMKIIKIGIPLETIMTGDFNIEKWKEEIGKEKEYRKKTKLTRKEKIEINREITMLII